ncbi:methyl-accepting chemotaxis protein [Lachnospira multipara]|uniref:Methyl-accepting chemotaxis protein n=1 Tax=Lachnospira multipara TaxID=28051 RepID=A0A1H5RUG1_9FIRM|nr:methyl-accepting chemotaxis protein [Lachnospira multipara]SEF41965.1 methyl-accepting chemotaxis protein [Lachnospira multipara]
MNFKDSMAGKLKKMKVADKFKYIFKNLYIYLGLPLIILLITTTYSLGSTYTMYNKYYKQDNLQGELRIDIQAYLKNAWWALSDRSKEDLNSHLDGCEEKISELDTFLSDLEDVYDNDDNIEAVRTDIKTLGTLTSELTALFAAGELTTTGMSNEADIYKFINEDVNSAVKTMASDLKAISSDSFDTAWKAFRTSLIATIVLLVVSVLFIVIAVIFVNMSSKVLNDSILSPSMEISKAAKDMADGYINIDIQCDSEDELGAMARDLEKATEVIKSITEDIIRTADKMAGGDFRSGSSNPELYIADYKAINAAFIDISNKLSSTLKNVKEASASVSDGAANLQDVSVNLSEGTSSQAAAVEELTASVELVTEQTELLAKDAVESMKSASVVVKDVETGTEKMSGVTKAMERITIASSEIEKITSTIESIASQTALLSLNASIEAARAGEAGRGFAVVAQEISELANESSTAAKNTHKLIDDTMNEIKTGNAAVEETTLALKKVQESVSAVAEMMKASKDRANAQASSMKEINIGIEQISNVVNVNSATAVQASQVSGDLSAQSQGLNALIDEFNIR